VAKKYPKMSAKNASSVKEQSPAHGAVAEARYATSEMMKEALAYVVKVHGSALRKLAK